MVVEDPSESAEFCDDLDGDGVELHLFLIGAVYLEVDVLGDVGDALFEGEGFEHGDREVLAFGLQAEDVEGKGGEGVRG